ncbi:RNA-binding protein 45 isoform X1 [Anarrhichthys ocellatus]|uniref:RNA-binding protein 45 isoform X1 n=1 Tax=Anarrhichthys ocellatus TaxID=433405 RepID=UPI0012ED1ED5|nr:RNA-binding protein 45 isoform X1 [Anarrhichthys ocellatus]XP_031695749.1 RNA-binding protein 45 isoform X1 [Anarrhichthys ocellatus]
MEEYPTNTSTNTKQTENLDEPPNSRLFVVTSRSITEDELRESFAVYGDVHGVWVVKDKQTKESKGIAYVKFAKSSQACMAMEDMHGKVLMEGTKPVKVFIAQSRSSTRHRDVEDEELTRIFVMIPKSFSEEDLKDTFKEYGDIEYCVIIKNKSTGESKGLGYVRYYKPSQAAVAIENCDKTYRAILAEPRTKAPATEDYSGGMSRGDYSGGGGGGGGDSSNQYAFPMGGGNAPRNTAKQQGRRPLATDPGNYPAMDYRSTSGDFTRCLMMSTRAALSQEQVFALFDIIPCMEYCELQRDAYGMSKGHALIRYANLGSAVYAKEKLNGFEYPPGNRLSVNFVDDGEDRSSPVGRMAMQFVATQMMSAPWNGPSPSQSMKPPSFPISPMLRIQTDVNLPPLKKLAPPDSKTKERLFVVFSPSPLPPDVLEDVYCRYGSLIEVHLVPGRKVGYMKYAEKQCADDAMAALHGQVVNGVKMKVMLADPPREESHKRPRNF